MYKNFRFKFIKTILAYEVLSETNFNIQKVFLNQIIMKIFQNILIKKLKL